MDKAARPLGAIQIRSTPFTSGVFSRNGSHLSVPTFAVTRKLVGGLTMPTTVPIECTTLMYTARNCSEDGTTRLSEVSMCLYSL